MRVQMIQGRRVDKPGGGYRVFEADRFYILPDKDAKALIAEGAAIDPDNPPPPPAPEPVPEPVNPEPVAAPEAPTGGDK